MFAFPLIYIATLNFHQDRMLKYRIRFNKARGQPGRGTQEHVWRVLQDDKEWLARHVIIEVQSRSEQEGPDWNIVCEGTMLFFEDTDTAVITK